MAPTKKPSRDAGEHNTEFRYSVRINSLQTASVIRILPRENIGGIECSRNVRKGISQAKKFPMATTANKLKRGTDNAVLEAVTGRSPSPTSFQ